MCGDLGAFWQWCVRLGFKRVTSMVGGLHCVAQCALTQSISSSHIATALCTAVNDLATREQCCF
eukprot:m.908704 g.908704  ORF g.908704 m.908704 type:complete len:64 (+) comp23715_c0_seq1:3-194(+)